ncbi:hypothetical protein Pcinc_023125 [Petrolisthes cinctipes]|uniref:Uncharacterized protein n=1 Tax=Petrolisthes cinctipes TaxID=88211 RepID=A0AAE1KG54_PETCI|nr:hypothetical protein Pcinc_023125 [Petrolisthes cinctipes]
MTSGDKAIHFLSTPPAYLLHPSAYSPHLLLLTSRTPPHLPYSTPPPLLHPTCLHSKNVLILLPNPPDKCQGQVPLPWLHPESVWCLHS